MWLALTSKFVTWTEENGKEGNVSFLEELWSSSLPLNTGLVSAAFSTDSHCSIYSAFPGLQLLTTPDAWALQHGDSHSGLPLCLTSQMGTRTLLLLIPYGYLKSVPLRTLTSTDQDPGQSDRAPPCSWLSSEDTSCLGGSAPLRNQVCDTGLERGKAVECCPPGSFFNHTPLQITSPHGNLFCCLPTSKEDSLISISQCPEQCRCSVSGL